MAQPSAQFITLVSQFITRGSQNSHLLYKKNPNICKIAYGSADQTWRIMKLL
jgi:hypothetical protein